MNFTLGKDGDEHMTHFHVEMGQNNSNKIGHFSIAEFKTGAKRGRLALTHTLENDKDFRCPREDSPRTAHTSP